MGLLLLTTSCSRVQHLAKVDYTHYELASDTSNQAQVEALIAPYKQQLDAEMHEVIGHCAETLTKRKPESTLGNWICDLIERHAAEHLGGPVDFAVQNYGGIRVGSLPAGPVRMVQMYDLMPFENRIVVLHMTGADLQEFLDHMAASDGWPVSKSLRYVVENDKAVNVEIGGVPLNPDRIYHFALPDYIANGGDNCFFLMDHPRDELPYLVRDAITDEVRRLSKQGLPITAALDGRITLANQDQQ